MNPEQWSEAEPQQNRFSLSFLVTSSWKLMVSDFQNEMIRTHDNHFWIFGAYTSSDAPNWPMNPEQWSEADTSTKSSSRFLAHLKRDFQNEIRTIAIGLSI